MSASPVRVLLVDDHSVYRLGLRALIESVEGFEVVGEAAGGTEAVRMAGELRPDVVVMDFQMPDLSGTEATRQIVGRCPGSGVLMLTYSDEQNVVLDAMLAGARGYVLKDAGQEDILRAIRGVAGGEMIFGASVAAKVATLLTGGHRQPSRPFPDLTEREHEVLDLMAQGLSNQAIAQRLGVGEKRVRNCATEIYTKLGVLDRPHAIIRAREAGMGRSR